MTRKDLIFGLLVIAISLLGFGLITLLVRVFYQPELNSSVLLNYCVSGQSFFPENHEKIIYFFSLLFAACSILTIYCFFYRKSEENHLIAWLPLNDKILSLINQYAWLSKLVVVLLLITIFLFCLFGIKAITNSGIYVFHFGAIFNSVVQTFQGNVLLGNTMHQYGLYPHFLEPIFQVIGLSVAKLTFVFGILMLIAMLALLKFIYGAVDNKNIARLGFIATIFWSYLFVRAFSHTHDYYFQYFPIRFIFPAVSLLLVWQYISTKKQFFYWLTTVWVVVAVLWNFDSGIVVLLSWLFLLIFQSMLERDGKLLAGRILSVLATTILVFLIYALCVFLRYNVWPDFFLLTAYANLFSNLGLLMLPVRLFHPWYLLIIPLLIGLIISTIALMEKQHEKQVQVIFFLSLLGLGLFVYYLGRSHVLNLLPVAYPSIILCAVYLDKLFQTRSAGRIAFLLSLFMLVSAILCVFSLPFAANVIWQRGGASIGALSTPVTMNINFIKDDVSPKKDILILSNLSGVYYLEAKIKPPINVPGLQDLVLKADKNKIIDYLRTCPSATLIVVDDNINDYADWQDFLVEINKHFRLKAENNKGKLSIWIKKGGNK